MRTVRISVAGGSGSGKSTLAQALAQRLDASYLELDGLAHQPGWRRLDDDTFRAEVAAFCAQERWVVDGNYSAVRDLVLARAHAAVLLHPPRHRVMRRLLRRTIRRMVTREELWNGNREDPRNLLSRDPATNILLWAWTTHDDRAAAFAEEMTDHRWRHVRFLRYEDDVTAGRVLSDL